MANMQLFVEIIYVICLLNILMFYSSGTAMELNLVISKFDNYWIFKKKFTRHKQWLVLIKYDFI